MPTGSAWRIAASTAARRAPRLSYSTAVKNATVIWEEKTLDAWLTNPQALILGQRMNFRVALPEDRADIIAYLRQHRAEQVLPSEAGGGGRAAAGGSCGTSAAHDLRPFARSAMGRLEPAPHAAG